VICDLRFENKINTPWIISTWNCGNHLIVNSHDSFDIWLWYMLGNGLVEKDSIGFINNPAGDGDREFRYMGGESNQTVYPSEWKYYFEWFTENYVSWRCNLMWWCSSLIVFTYTGGIPPDGTPRMGVVTYHLALVVTYDILAAVGIAFTTVCLVFNFAFRNRKWELFCT